MSHDPFGDLDAALDETGAKVEIRRTVDGGRRVLLTYATGEVDGYGRSTEEALGALLENVERRRLRMQLQVDERAREERLVSELGASVAVNDYRRQVSR